MRPGIRMDRYLLQYTDPLPPRMPTSIGGVSRRIWWNVNTVNNYRQYAYGNIRWKSSDAASTNQYGWCSVGGELETFKL
jgi:hypothetical protein